MTRILQLSDTHLVAPPKLVSKKLDTYSLFGAAVDRVINDLTKIGPIDAVVVTGDVSDDGSVGSYEAFREIIERIDLPYYVIPGNHDCRETMLGLFNDSKYNAGVEKFHWVKRFGDMQLIGLDTVVPKSGGGIFDSVSLDFLASSLSSDPEIPTMIAMHHPPFISGVHFMDAISLKGSDAFAELLQSVPNDIRIICGHLHTMVVGSVGNRVAISSPATCSSFDVDYRTDAPVGYTTKPGGYMIHDWSMGFRSTCVPLIPGNDIYPF